MSLADQFNAISVVAAERKASEEREKAELFYKSKKYGSIKEEMLKCAQRGSYSYEFSCYDYDILSIKACLERDGFRVHHTILTMDHYDWAVTVNW